MLLPRTTKAATQRTHPKREQGAEELGRTSSWHSSKPTPASKGTLSMHGIKKLIPSKM